MDPENCYFGGWQVPEIARYFALPKEDVRFPERQVWLAERRINHVRPLVVLALVAIACSSSPEESSSPEDAGADVTSDGQGGSSGLGGAGGVDAAAGSGASAGEAGASGAGQSGAGGSTVDAGPDAELDAGTGGLGGAGGAAGSSTGGGAGTAGADAGPQQCPSACVTNASFEWSVPSGAPKPPNGVAHACGICPAGSTFDPTWMQPNVFYCTDCGLPSPQKFGSNQATLSACGVVPAGDTYFCSAPPGAPQGSCTMHFRCKATNWCVELAKPCP